MRPVQFREQNTEWAKNQDQYGTLPAHCTPEGISISCWEISPAELRKVKKTKRVWVWQHTFGRTLQPISMETDCPFSQPPRPSRWYRLKSFLKMI